MIETERLLLRQWTDSDRAPFAELNADPVVMEHFPTTLTREQSDAFVDRMISHLTDRGWGLWAVEVLETGRFIGFVGLWPIAFDPFAGREQREIGWRLARSAWDHGYATEAARAALEFAFSVLGWVEVVSFTARSNVKSQRVMERIGMTRDPSSDFDHPAIPPDHPLRPHVVYRVQRTLGTGHRSAKS
ncbi:MAG: GNAT family N-acetyltransferase [Acidimicrobiia bacterium]|nr:GNAT family N-acetyltransferase [Acidimicrobiia bacterium]MDH4306582.1 GNAT family N-acetyltransferase [Acidimicrobiia bacterium]